MNIDLTRGYLAVVDDADYDRVVGAGPWHVWDSAPTSRYAVHSIDSTKQLHMHTFITGWDYVDHINGDGLDNRRQNLRQASHGQNMFNKRRYSNNTSGFQGVYPKRNRWAATVNVNKRQVHVGYFGSPEEAARARDAAALEAYGEFVRLNFPKEIA